MARCEGDNRIVLLGPKPMGNVVCVNGHLPVRVQSGDGPCDYSYECECESPPLGGGCAARHLGHAHVPCAQCPGSLSPPPVRLGGLKGSRGFLRSGRGGDHNLRGPEQISPWSSTWEGVILQPPGVLGQLK